MPTTLAFAKLAVPEKGTLVILADENLGFGPAAAAVRDALGGRLERAAKVAGFKGKSLSTLDLVAPSESFDRVLVVGLGKETPDWLKLGGAAAGKLGEVKAASATMLLETPAGPLSPEQAADVALGARLRGYAFEKYRTKRKDDDGEAANEVKLALAVAEPAAARRAWAQREPICDGVVLARDLVNEPPNVLGPAEFAARAQDLSALGVEVEVLDEAAMRSLGMNAFLGVGQGSARPPRLVVMRWNGARSDRKPVAFVGKGVVFDTGGISIKPAQGMEDMKGDMGGAAAVTGLMRALAGRKAKANVIGALGLVENMPDGNAQRPGDIVASMSGQTIEIINTDAEGRLVLADVLWYIQDRFKPAAMIDLATLTGAIMVALGQQHAGLFATSDEVAEALTAAGKATGELVWRMPLAPEYDKLIDSKVADMKNTGGRYGGAITAAQFLKRFTNDVPWAHLDVAGTAMNSPATEINRSWGSGWGVRLLDRFVADHHER